MQKWIIWYPVSLAKALNHPSTKVRSYLKQNIVYPKELFLVNKTWVGQQNLSWCGLRVRKGQGLPHKSRFPGQQGSRLGIPRKYWMDTLLEGIKNMLKRKLIQHGGSKVLWIPCVQPRATPLNYGQNGFW